MAAGVPAWYAGNIQGRNPRETGLRGGLWVEAQKGFPVEPEFVPLGRLVWQTVNAVCSPEIANLAELLQDLAGQMKAALKPNPAPGGLEPGYLVRLVLNGRSPLADLLRDPDELATLAGDLEQAAGIPWVEVRPGSLTRPLDLAAMRQGPGVLATALELIGEAQKNEATLGTLTPERLAYNGPPEAQAAYLQELLAGLDGELAERLMPEEEE